MLVLKVDDSDLLKEFHHVLVTTDRESGLDSNMGPQGLVDVNGRMYPLLFQSDTWEGKRDVLWVRFGLLENEVLSIKGLKRETDGPVELTESDLVRVVWPSIGYSRASDMAYQVKYNVNGYVTAREREFFELVGSLSQAVNYCSYDDDGILCSVLNGTLNAEVLRRNAEYGPDSNRKAIEAETGYPVETDFEGLLLGYMIQTGGWPVHYGAPVVPLKALWNENPAYVDMFDKADKFEFISDYSRDEAPCTLEERDLRIAHNAEYDE